MTFKTILVDPTGAGIPDLLVTANNENTGESFSRSTDGQGFADVAMLGHSEPGQRVTLFALDPQLRFKGFVLGDALVLGSTDQEIRRTLDPF